MAKYIYKNKKNKSECYNDIFSSVNKEKFDDFITKNTMQDIDENLQSCEQNETNKKYEKDWRLELFALIGFCVSGVIFIISGLKNKDIFTIFGSSVWIASCIVWMIPYRKYF
ncbi:hypothetical protein [Desulfoplanes sp.]